MLAMGEVDPDFIYPIDNRPKLTKIEDDGIPIIDLSCITSLDHLPTSNSAITDANIHALVAEIGDACYKWGFFQVINHGVPFDKITNLQHVVGKFFGQSKDEKRKVKRCLRNPLGYSDDEHTGPVKDWKEGFDFAVNDSTLALVSPDDPNAIKLSNRWPEYLPELRDVAQEYATDVTKLVVKLLELIALSLNMAAKRLTEFYNKDPALFMRFNHYMACPCPDLALGIGAHKDSGGLTILCEDQVGGLQVKRKSDGEWITVKPIRGAFVVNIGDVLQVWSNDKYESVDHRVILNPEKARLSVAFIFGPAYNVNVKPLEELVDEHNPAKYDEFNYGAFRASIIRANLMKPNIPGQKISQFKITNN